MAVAVSPRDRHSRAPDWALLRRFAATRDPDLRALLIERHLPMARHLANRYSRSQGARHSREDLEQVAALGLVKAIDRFSPDRGVAFSSFAFPTILGELRRYLRDHDWGVRVPRRVYELSVRVERASDAFRERHGRAPTTDEIATAVEADPEDVVEALSAAPARRPLSLEAPVHPDDGQPLALADTVGDDRDLIGAVDDTQMLAQRLHRLPMRARRVVLLRYYGDLTQVEIAERLGVSQMQVSRTLSAALRDLQEAACETAAPS